MSTAIPNHVAFIMDGNGRWAESQGLSRVEGHRAGAETVRRIATHARNIGIPYLTLYAFSTENWKRPQAEVDALMALLGQFIEDELPTLQQNNIRLKTIGDLAALAEPLQQGIANAVRSTSANDALTLILAINYGGRDELVRAARRLLATSADAQGISEETLAAELDSAGIPDPDLLVRTAGEQRLSNFLLWQAAYAELYFTDVCWPAFMEADFDAALETYARRIRKFGGA